MSDHLQIALRRDDGFRSAAVPVSFKPGEAHGEAHGEVVNDAVVHFDEAASDWGTLVSFVIFDGENKVIYESDLMRPVEVKAGDRVYFDVGAIQATFDGGHGDARVLADPMPGCETAAEVAGWP